MILFLCLLCGATAFATTNITGGNDNTEKTATTEVTYTVTGGYTVTIPSKVEITDTSATAEVSIDANPILPAGYSYVQVQLNSGENWSGSTWRLANTEDSNQKIPYSITKTGTTTAVYRNTPLLQQMTGATEVASTTLTFTLTGEATAAGSYSDTLTFTVKLSDASSNYAQ